LLQSDQSFRKRCVDSLLDYTAVQCLRLHPASSPVQAHALRLLAALAFGNDKVRRRAGEEGAMLAVVSAMKMHSEDTAVLTQALAAVTNLTHNSLENKMR
jgi:hypothetical protein